MQCSKAVAATHELVRKHLERLWKDGSDTAQLTSPPPAPPTEAASKPWSAFFDALLKGPDREGALLGAMQLPDEFFEQPPPPQLARLLHHGSYSARLLRLAPWTITALERPVQIDGESSRIQNYQDALLQDLRREGETHPPEDALARIRTREYLYVAHLECNDSPLEVTGGCLSALAAACVQYALESITLDKSPLSDSVVAFGMGKLGGYELNFLSDIDLVFVHADELDETQRRRLHDQLRKVVTLLEGQGKWRPLFRVDLRLRPFGTQGPLSLSLSATESYYERHGRPWERQAWLRALPLAGNLELGETLQKRLRPFVYRRNVGPEIFEEIAELMQRARRDGQLRQTTEGGLDLKLDAGGIREIEFFVQALQLLNGGKHPALRTRSTLGALDRLAATGFISDREHQVLSYAYRWLRKTEHRLQLAEGQAIHTLPVDSDKRKLLSARLKESSEVSGTFMEQRLEQKTQTILSFDEQCTHHRTLVSEITRSVYPAAEHDQSALPSNEESEAEAKTQSARELLLDPAAPQELRRNAFAHLGFRDPEEATAQLDHLYSRPEGAFLASARARSGAQKLLLACVESADPDHALSRLVEFAATRPGHYAAWRFFAHPGAHETVRRVADLFGASEPLSRGLIGFPSARGIESDGGLSLLLEASRDELPATEDFRRHFEQLRSIAPEAPIVQTLLRLKQRELVRIGLSDLGQQADPMRVGRCLADLADFSLRHLLRDLQQNGGLDSLTSDLRIAVFALGKYGMRAMDYGSDLDLFLVHDSADPQVHFAVQAIGRKFHRLIQGSIRAERLYEVDFRLRPSGQQGLLVSSLNGFSNYHQKELPLWERLALIHCRAIAELHLTSPVQSPSVTSNSPEAVSINDSTNDLLAHLAPSLLSHQITNEILQRSVYRKIEHLDSQNEQQGNFAHIAAAIRELKNQIERELARETSTAFNVKTGIGGCLELEFLVSALQLNAGAQDPQIRNKDVLSALRYLAEINVLERSQAEALEAAYLFHRRLLNRLRLSHSGVSLSDPDRLVTNSPLLRALARRMGIPDRDTLLDTYLAHRQQVRHAFDHFFPPPSSNGNLT